MQITLDAETLSTTDSIESALDAARERAEASGRLIVEIHADGAPIADELLDNPPSDSQGISELHFVSVDPKEFMLQTLSDTRESLAGTKAEQTIAAGLVQSGKLTEAIESLGSILEGWHAARDVVDQLSALAQIDLNTLQIDDTSGAECINGLTQTLGEVRDAVTSEDWSSLGDLLEYDLDQQASAWMSLIDALEHTLTKH
jgi:hypothetical protein